MMPKISINIVVISLWSVIPGISSFLRWSVNTAFHPVSEEDPDLVNLWWASLSWVFNILLCRGKNSSDAEAIDLSWGGWRYEALGEGRCRNGWNVLWPEHFPDGLALVCRKMNAAHQECAKEVTWGHHNRGAGSDIQQWSLPMAIAVLFLQDINIIWTMK